MAREEYDREVEARQEAEAEMARLKELLVEQASKLTEMEAVSKEADVLQRRSRELRTTVDGMEKHLSTLKVERDMTLAEVEELAQVKR